MISQYFLPETRPVVDMCSSCCNKASCPVNLRTVIKFEIHVVSGRSNKIFINSFRLLDFVSLFCTRSCSSIEIILRSNSRSSVGMTCKFLQMYSRCCFINALVKHWYILPVVFASEFVSRILKTIINYEGLFWKQTMNTLNINWYKNISSD